MTEPNYRDIPKRCVKGLSIEECESVREMREAGFAYKRIAEKYKCSITTIYGICKGMADSKWDATTNEKYKTGFVLAMELRKDFADGVCRKDLAEKYKIARSSVTQIINNKRFVDENYKCEKKDLGSKINFTVEEILSIRKRHDDGENIYKITDDFRNKIKCNPTGTIRKICKREMFKTI
jgi:Mor family transcriptional regulator